MEISQTVEIAPGLCENMLDLNQQARPEHAPESDQVRGSLTELKQKIGVLNEWKYQSYW